MWFEGKGERPKIPSVGWTNGESRGGNFFQTKKRKKRLKKETRQAMESKQIKTNGAGRKKKKKQRGKKREKKIVFFGKHPRGGEEGCCGRESDKWRVDRGEAGGRRWGLVGIL